MSGEAGEYRVRRYSTADDEAWDDLVASSCNGTFLQTRRFLGYHGDRFDDRSLVVHDPRDRIHGVIPAAVDPGDGARVVSHPGITYGGIVHDGSLHGETLVGVLDQVADQLATLGHDRFLYKAVPWIYHRVPACDDVYALFRGGARLHACLLSATLDLSAPGRRSHGRRSALRQAERSGVEATVGWAPLPEFWEVLVESLAERHGAAPVHSLGEMEHIHELFPAETRLVVARVAGRVVAGAVLFSAGPVLHTQYLASSTTGRATSALDLVISESIAMATDEGFRYFDFGTSNEEGGRVLNDPLYRYKRSFGASGVTLQHFEVDLRGSAT